MEDLALYRKKKYYDIVKLMGGKRDPPASCCKKI